MWKQNFVTWRGWFPQSRNAACGLLLREAEACSATSTSVWWTDERPLAVVIPPEWSRHCHLKLLIVVTLSTTTLTVPLSLHVTVVYGAASAGVTGLVGCSLQCANTFRFCASAIPSPVCYISTSTSVYYLDLQGTWKSVKFSCCCHKGIIFDTVKKKYIT